MALFAPIRLCSKCSFWYCVLTLSVWPGVFYQFHSQLQYLSNLEVRMITLCRSLFKKKYLLCYTWQTDIGKWVSWLCTKNSKLFFISFRKRLKVSIKLHGLDNSNCVYWLCKKMLHTLKGLWDSPMMNHLWSGGCTVWVLVETAA